MIHVIGIENFGLKRGDTVYEAKKHAESRNRSSIAVTHVSFSSVSLETLTNLEN